MDMGTWNVMYSNDVRIVGTIVSTNDFESTLTTLPKIFGNIVDDIGEVIFTQWIQFTVNSSETIFILFGVPTKADCGCCLCIDAGGVVYV